MNSIFIVIVILTAGADASRGIMTQSAASNLLASQDVEVLAEFFVAVGFQNTTPVSSSNVCRAWSDHVVCNGASITELNFVSSRLSGTIPSSLSKLTTIVQLTLDLNDISGTLPPELGDWRLLRTFTLRGNRFSGTLSATFANWTSLSSIDLGDNVHLTGTLSPAFASWGSSGSSRFDTLRVQNNSFYGTLPAEYSAWGNAMLNFDVSSNALNGTLPPSYAAFVNLQTFYTYSNHFSGGIPDAYASFQQLQRFTAHSNDLNGTLSSNFSQWGTNLSYFNVFNNKLSGQIPESYAAWGASIVSITLSNNLFSGSFPSTWGLTMTSLTSLVMINNSLQGSLHSNGLFRALSLLAISFNNFSGTLPSGSTFPVLLAFDAQNNSHFSGPVKFTNPLVLLSMCGTQLCAYALVSAYNYDCFPAGLIANQSDVAIILTLSFAYTTQDVNLCLSTVASPTISPSIPLNSTDAPDNVVGILSAAGKATTSVTVATVIASALSGVDASDAQMLVSILGSPCACSAAAAGDSSTLLQLALSPFSPIGSSWTVIGNAFLCCLLIAVHVASVKLMLWRVNANPQRSDRRNRRDLIPTVLGRWLSGGRKLRQVCMRLRFPNLSVSLVLLLAPGVLRATVSVSQSISNDSVALDYFSIVVGVVFTFGGAAAIELLLYRHIEQLAPALYHQNATVSPSSSSLSVSQRATSSAAHHLKFTPHLHVEKLFAPIPVNIAKVVLPRGRWEPSSAKKSYGGIVSGFVGEWRRAWRVMVFENWMVHLLNSIHAGHDGCNALQGLTMGLLMCTSVFFAVVRPHRALLASYLTSASLLLTCTVALMAMLCRLETVDQSAVDDFGMFVSVTMMLIKVYTVAYPYAEAWLLMRNNASTISGSEPNEDSFSGLTESFASIGRGSSESFSSSSGGGSFTPRAAAAAVLTPEMGATAPPALVQRPAEEVLRELILAIAAKRQAE